MFSYINRNVILPLYLRRQGDKRLHRMAELEKLQWLSREESQARQFEKAKSLISYAYENVPFYRERYNDVGFHPGDLKSFADLNKLPTLSKKDIQENLPQLVSKTYSKAQLRQDASGGSTGVPTVFYTDNDNRDLRRGAALLYDSWTGWKVGEKISYLWGADRDTNILRTLKDKAIHKYVYRTSLLNAFHLDEETMRRHVDAITRDKPSLVVAYANVAFFFAKFIKESGLSIPAPKGIVCSAETLTEEKRAVIESAFGCKALNRYASREIGLIAAECTCQAGLHVNAEDVFVEIDGETRSEGNETFGEIIVTDFNNRAMPFIRYRTGDVGVSGNDRVCDCGRGSSLIKEVKGRTSDFLFHKEGYLIHGESFSHAFYGIREISRFQVHQKTIDDLLINIVGGEGYSSVHRDLVRQKVRDIIGDGVRITVHEVDEIAVPVSGKFKFAISDIAN